MEYTRLGATGLQVSRICLGMMSYGSSAWRDWVLDLDASRPLVRAPSTPVIFFDTADMYSRGASEEVTGTLLREFFARRDDYVLATKVFNPMGDGPNDRGLSRKHVLASIDASLRRLGTDHVDLYQIHRWDPHTPIEETMEALHDVVRAGKARYIGASSMFAWQFAKAQHIADLGGWTRFVSHAGPLQPDLPRGGAGDAPAVPRPGRRGDPVEPAGPRAAGRSHRSERHHDPRGQRRRRRPQMYGEADDAVVQRGRRRRQGPRAAAGAGRAGLDAAAGGVTAPIVGATKPGHIEDAVAAVDVELTDDEVAALEAPYVPHPVPRATSDRARPRRRGARARAAGRRRSPPG